MYVNLFTKKRETRTHMYTYIYVWVYENLSYSHIYKYIYIYMCVCVRVCVYVCEWNSFANISISVLWYFTKIVWRSLRGVVANVLDWIRLRCMFICAAFKFHTEWNNALRVGTSTTTIHWSCPWCNGYRRRKWTRRHEFKSWTRLIAFHIALIPLGKVWIQLFSLRLWVNCRADWVLQPWGGN